MAGIQIGGIVSGMDTNALVEQLTEKAQIPVDALYSDRSEIMLEDEVYESFNDKLGNLTSDLLTLRLESTFKTKNTTSTNESSVTASASTDAATGSHSVKVLQMANNAMAASSYSKHTIVETGANVLGISGGTAIESLEGEIETTVGTLGANYVAVSTFTPDNLSQISKSQGIILDGAVVNSYGIIQADINGDMVINYTDDTGAAQTLSMTVDLGDVDVTAEHPVADDITKVAANLQSAINAGLNSSMGTNNVQYVAIRADYGESGDWAMSIYETTTEDYNISIGGTDAGTLRDELGFGESDTLTTSTANDIKKYFVSDVLTDTDDATADLQSKVFDGVSGVAPGATNIELSSSSPTLGQGTFTIRQDSSLNVSADTYTRYKSSQVSGGAGLDASVKGLENAGFTDTVDANANGYFTINDTKITIEDYTEISVNELVGIINASGAGVVASYDSSTDRFEIRSNNTGPTSITLGGYSDTSNILSVMNLGATERAYKEGSSAANIDTTADLQNAGFTTYPYSGTFSINGVSIYVDAAVDTMADVIEKVNKSGAGVTMGYDTISDKVTLTSDSTDAIEVGSPNDTSNLLESFNLTSSATTTTTIGSEGQSAILEVNGQTYVRDSNAVSDIINGVTFMLNGESDTASTINVAIDTDKAVDAFAKFIAHYNEIMAELNISDYDEDDRDDMVYLTDKKKESMSDTAVEEYMEKYEKLHKEDIIRRSSELKNMDTTLRRIFFSVRPGITSSINDMSDLGIEVGGAGDYEKEQLGYLVEISTDYETIAASLKDNSDFMDALTNSSDDVHTFFAQSSDYDKGTDDYNNEVGWARYFSDMVENRYTSTEGMIGGKLGNSGTLYRELTRVEDRILDQEDRVESQLERYWAQFTAMEKAIADAQAQAADFNNAAGG